MIHREPWGFLLLFRSSVLLFTRREGLGGVSEVLAGDELELLETVVLRPRR